MKLLQQIKAYFQTKHQLYQKIKKLSHDNQQLETKCQIAEEQVDELLSKESQREHRLSTIKESYDYVIQEKDAYLDRVGTWINIFEELESYMEAEDVKEMTDTMRKISDQNLKTIIKYLKYYKHDIVHRSLKLPKDITDQARRSWAVSSIDAMMILLNWCLNQVEYVDRIVWENKTSFVDREKKT